MHDPWGTLLTEVKRAHQSVPAVQEFCTFPERLDRKDIAHHPIPASDLMCNDPGLYAEDFAGFRDALIAAAPLAHWRETYKGTGIGADFLDRFGCFEIIGRDAPYGCADMRGFVVYAPSGLHYPWHHHPAEELYLVLAGEAEFAVEGAHARAITPGGSVFHATMQPHAMTTHAHPVMAYVLWRGDLDTRPVLTCPGGAP